ncbi:MAG: LacI family transcriptional regulator [Denitromonas halophila]|nr:MAG: LacI family transcriptional regulator [Denitromonas halophila]
MVTIKDIARELGVSPSTVTRALAGNTRISAETIRRVREQAEQMGYVADSAARAMRSGTSALIGLLVPDIQNSFYATMARIAAQCCQRAGYQLVLSVTEDDPEIEERHVRALIGARCAGVMVVPTGGVTPATCQLLSGVPTVQLIRRAEGLRADSFGVNDRQALFAATGYLLDLGHRRIALLVGDKTLDTARARFNGYVDAFAARGLQPDIDLVCAGAPRASQGSEALRALLSRRVPPTAIVAAGAALTEGMLDAVRAHYGSTYPDVSLLGFGDTAAFRWWQGEGLSTIALPITTIAEAAGARLLALIKTPRAAAPPVESVSFDTSMVLRGSARPPVERS